ncbi:MAG: DNA repair protein RecO [Peptococcaceae bacterium]|nr:DNA repair protein RecO [Peptococcaceae bacterium]
MSTYKVDALVIRSREFKESDRIVTLYSRECGKISAVAKGVRKSTSKQRAGVQLYTYADFMLYKGRSLDTIQQAHPREVFLYLWDDYERVCSAGCMAEVLDAATPDGETDERVFLLSLKFLFMLEAIDPWMALAAYGLRLMAHLGYMSGELGIEGVQNELGIEGVQNSIVTEGAKSAMRQLGRMPWDQMGRLRLSSSQRREICRGLRSFCESKVERRLIAWRSFEEDCEES